MEIQWHQHTTYNWKHTHGSFQFPMWFIRHSYVQSPVYHNRIPPFLPLVTRLMPDGSNPFDGSLVAPTRGLWLGAHMWFVSIFYMTRLTFAFLGVLTPVFGLIFITSMYSQLYLIATWCVPLPSVASSSYTSVFILWSRTNGVTVLPFKYHCSGRPCLRLDPNVVAAALCQWFPT